ncbi:TetR family transcriptional regulator [Gordonia sp. ABSL49_1]|uniref:TetR/AcrR family transcriptional regulator n=1 Tax=Gordonia sp. ABSL49_1 TaxID=2920941 RepID=UPI001F0E02FE|nr:TetR family transcriptional regulator [Gordonia sp. ABSL49_1]MCH5643273.1 TetR family transcriptional regulator [Gordonia sp. ABSL49_1]
MSERKRGRPRLDAGRPDSREAILTAARELFAERGFDRTTMRAIASRAGVDPALIHHYFGNKNALTVEALRPQVDPTAVLGGLDAYAPHLGTEFVTRVLTIWENDAAQRERAIALLRIAVTHDEVAERMRAFFIGMATMVLGDFALAEDRELRIALIASHVLGILMMRFVLRQPDIAGADIGDLAARMGPAIDHYLTGGTAV